jgi:hypothetical protein
MILRGTYQGDRVIILDGAVGLRPGQAVEVQPAPRARAAKPAKPRRIWGAGMWADRPDFKGKSAKQIARQLRRKAMGARYRA